MDKILHRLRLMELFSIFFIYMIIKALVFDKNSLVAFIWILFLVFYIILLIIMYVMIKNWEKKAKLMQNLKILF